MCGICGVVHRERMPVDRAALEQMRDAMAYRGPDGVGLYVDRGVGLGHRRLAVIDLATGDQPMTNEAGTLHLIFNGEIYNYLELRDECIAAGQTFRTRSDTEVILRLYERLGDACVSHLNGMFAFAIWDTRTRELFVARDRVGVKPLYYTVRGETLLFASEMKALLRHPLVSVDIAPTAIDEFLTYGYVQTPGTICQGVLRLPEGHLLRWRDGQITLKRYWDLDFTPDESTSETEHRERVLALLRDSIRLRLRSDVPVGVFLSGGVDSSAVATLLAQGTGRIKTFSIGFDFGSDYTELREAAWLARRLGSDHHQLTLDSATFRAFVPKFAYYMDEPVSEAPAIPLFFVSQLAAGSVKVVLSGEGADETFAGYPTYVRLPYLERLHALPSWMRSPRLARLAPPNQRDRADKYLYLAGQPLERRYLSPHLFDPRDRAALYSPEFRRRLGGFDAIERIDSIYAHTKGWDLLSRMLYLDTKTWLPNDILIKSDRMSMANSIELRVPFLDYRLIEYAARIPSRLKVHGRRTKSLLKDALGSVLPAEILSRGKKGFPTPVAAMLRGELGGYARELLFDGVALSRRYFNTAAVEALFREHTAGTADHHSALWRLIVLEQWHREYVDNATRLQQATPSAAPHAAAWSGTN
jgi:asparagine synthase (glutamine-hydrolysing)